MKDPAISVTLSSIPIMKLRADKLESSIMALVSSETKLRKDIVERLRAHGFEGKDEKHGLRALVQHALTRLHFARADLPYLREAPNARIWSRLDELIRPVFTSIVLYDFATIHLRITPQLIPPLGNLREIAKPFGPKMVDRVRGLNNMLSYYSSFHSRFSSGEREVITDSASQLLPK